MYNVDLRDGAHSAHILPPQAIPLNQKDKDWQMDCMDSLENIGLRYLSRYRYSFDRAYKIVDGRFEYTDITDSSVFLTEVEQWREQANLPDTLQHYGFIEPIINQLVGEFIRKPNPIIIDAVDTESTNDYIRTKTDMLWDSVTTSVDQEIEYKIQRMGIDPYKQEFQTPEEQQAHQEQVQQAKQALTPPEIEKHMNQNWKNVYVEWAEQTIEEDNTRFDLEEIDRDCMTDYLITGRCFRHVRMGYDYYMPERWSPLNTFCGATSKTRYVEEGDYGGRIHYYTPNEIIKYYGNLLSESQKRDITKSKYYSKTEFNRTRDGQITDTQSWIEHGGGTLSFVPFPAYYPYENAKYLQEITGVDMGIPEFFPRGYYHGEYFDDEDDYRYDLIRTVEAYWKSFKRVGYLTMENENGKLVTDIVTDEILRSYIRENKIKEVRTVSLQQHEASPKANTIVWDYIEEVWKGVKINRHNTDLSENLYLAVEPLEYQLQGESSIYHTRLPLTGIVDKTSMVSKIYQYQIDYNIAMNMAADYMSKELGIFYVMDFTYLPTWIKNLGGEESLSKLHDVIKELGFIPIDGSAANTRSNFNQFTSINMDLTTAMVGKLDYARMVKRLAFESLGLLPERVGQPVEVQTATGVEAGQNASFAQTEVIFDRFAKHKKRSAEVMLNIAQYMKTEGKDVTKNFVDGDKIRHFLKISDPDLPMRRFKIFLENNSKRRGELELIKQVYMNDNTIARDLESVASVVTSDSVSKIMHIARLGRKRAEIAEEQKRIAEERQLAMKLESEAAEKERERQWKSRENHLDRQKDLYEQAILALGFTEDDDVNNNNQLDVLEQLKLSLDKLKAETDKEDKEAKRKQVELDSEREYLGKQEDRQIKRDEINAKLKVSEDNKEIARENKNQYDKKKTNDKK